MGWHETIPEPVVVEDATFQETRQAPGSTWKIQKRNRRRVVLEYRGLLPTVKDLLMPLSVAYANGSISYEARRGVAGEWNVTMTADWAPGGENSWSDGVGDFALAIPVD